MAYEEEQSLSDDKKEKLIQEANERWEVCDNHYADLYRACKEDWHFLHGQGQWDTGSKDVRNKDGRPSLVLNQCLPYAHQITNEIKQARLAIRVVPIDSEADIETAEIRAGIIRNIEKQSRSKTVYGTAAMNAIGSGLGWIRVKVDYADDMSFDQEAFLERVLDFTSIYLDPSDMSLDGSEADYGFVRVDYEVDKFKEIYPDANPISFGGLSNKEEVSIVEYFYKECDKKTLHEVSIKEVLIENNGIQTPFKPQENIFAYDEDLKKLDEKDIPYEKLRSREVDDYKVYHCVLNGEEILSRERFPCHYIPLVPVIGEEYYTAGKREFHSLIRQAKDAQRMYNYWKSASTEMIALQPKAPFIAPVGSFQSYPDHWANANTENMSTLEYDVVHDEETGSLLPPPQRQPPAQGSATMMQEAIGARDDIRLSLGIPQSNMGERSNTISGIAIRNQQVQGDNATFHFIDNLSSSIAQVGRILNDIIPEIYSDRKISRIIGEDGTEENIPVNVPYVKDQEGTRAVKNGEQPEGIYDLSVGKYDIDMDVGPSYASKRQETADKLNELMGIQPELVGIVGDLAVEALDVPMSKEIAERLRTQMDPSILGDDPQAQQLQAAAQKLEQMQETLANYEAALQDKSKNEKFDQATKAEELQLERDKFQVDAKKTKADIAKIYADIQNTNAQTVGQKEENLSVVADIAERVAELGIAVDLIIDNAPSKIEPSIIDEEVVTGSPQEEELA